MQTVLARALRYERVAFHTLSRFSQLTAVSSVSVIIPRSISGSRRYALE
ncbi:MAG: hypothetical protein BWY96_01478 [Spirochaetes bacterium ADurb.BinA120]|nr:MAG: hypothetical protein BWY96_01478 [Spirochaetes bacterium ADurb.BinA120]